MAGSKVMSTFPVSSPADLIIGIREMFEAYQKLTTINPHQDAGFVIKHLTKVFDGESRLCEGLETGILSKIRKVYQIYKTLSKWDAEDAPGILMENLAQILVHTNLVKIEPGSVISIKNDDDLCCEDEPNQIEVADITMETREEEEEEDYSKDEEDQGRRHHQIKPLLSSKNSSSSNLNKNKTSSHQPALVVAMDTKTKNKNNSDQGFKTGKKIHTCRTCKRTFERLSSYSNHIKTHGLKSPSLKKQMMTIPISRVVKKYTCVYCTKKFRDNRDLTHHIRTHTGEKPYACPHPKCEKRFTVRSAQKTHMKIHYRPFPCHFSNICLLSFNTSTARSRHEFLRHDEGGNEADSDRFQDIPQSKSNHQDEDEEEEEEEGNVIEKNDTFYSESEPDYDYDPDFEPSTSPASRWERSRTLSGNEGQQKFVCEVCFKSFSKACYLKVHRYLHTGERPFACRFCSKKFNNRGIRYTHEQQHKTSK